MSKLPDLPHVRGLDVQLLEDSAEDLYENAPCGYYSTLPDGRFVKVNQTFVEWMGYTALELLGGLSVQALLNVVGRIYHDTHYAPLLQIQGFAHEVAFDFVRRDGSLMPVFVNTRAKLGPDGKTALYRTTVFNATDRRKYERELLLARRRAEAEAQARADLLATLSHEIRSPLGVVRNTAVLLDHTPLTDKQQSYVRMLKSSSDNLIALINDILDYSRMQSDQATLEQRRFSLHDLVSALVDAFCGSAEEKGITLLAEIDEHLPRTLCGDPVKIRQVLTNLVGNALKFTEQGSIIVAVEVKARTEKNVTIELSVSDTGIGIEHDRLPHIFEEFTQASYDIGLKYGGTGLGLAISRKILSLYGTQMQVQSEPGRGSRFSFAMTLVLPKPD